jgi:hypothetical protein
MILKRIEKQKRYKLQNVTNSDLWRGGGGPLIVSSCFAIGFNFI